MQLQSLTVHPSTIMSFQLAFVPLIFKIIVTIVKDGPALTSSVFRLLK